MAPKGVCVTPGFYFVTRMFEFHKLQQQPKNQNQARTKQNKRPCLEIRVEGENLPEKVSSDLLTCTAARLITRTHTHILQKH